MRLDCSWQLYFNHCNNGHGQKQLRHDGTDYGNAVFAGSLRNQGCKGPHKKALHGIWTSCDTASHGSDPDDDIAEAGGIYDSLPSPCTGVPLPQDPQEYSQDRDRADNADNCAWELRIRRKGRSNVREIG